MQLEKEKKPRKKRASKPKAPPRKSNVVQFPNKHKNFAATASLQELRAEVEKNRIEFVNFMVTELLDDIFFKMSTMGFMFDDPKYIKDCVLVSESIKSLVLKSLNVEHAMQAAAEKLISVETESVKKDA
jgi:hypothetical protein